MLNAVFVLFYIPGYPLYNMPSSRHKPKHKITWWMRVKRYFRRVGTPFRVRDSIHRLSHISRHPYLRFISLLLPFPSWFFSLPRPLAPQEIAKNIELYELRHVNLDSLRWIPIWRARDTPIRAIYRIYEILLTGEYTLLRVEVEYFWYQRKWTLRSIPDPHDTNPVRYAVLASIVEELADAFNWRLGLGLRRDHRHVDIDPDDGQLISFPPETVPSWTQSVPPIASETLKGLPLDMLDEHGNLVLESEGENSNFGKRNIVTGSGWFYTI